MPQLFRLDIFTSDLDDDTMSDAVQGVLARLVTYGWEEESLPTGETRFRVHGHSDDFAQQLVAEIQAFAPDARLERDTIEDKDWLAAWREFFTPVHCGRFVVLPPWLKDSTDLAGALPIVIEPKSAFGTGHHPTTVLCLLALSELLNAGRLTAGQRFYDLGTGSGVLGIGCALAGLSGAGSDIDPLAVDNATENALINNVAPRFEIRSGSAEAAQAQQHDVVLANILAGPLRELAPSVIPLVKPGGVLILSGILSIQADSVAEAYAALGTPRRLESGEWACLIWRQG